MNARQYQVSEDEAKDRRRHRRELLSKKRRRQEEDRLLLRNFRPVAGLAEASRVFRSGSTDVLGAKLRYNVMNWSEAETLVLRDAGLIIDLRSAPERNQDDAKLWMKEASNEIRKPPIQVLELPVCDTNHSFDEIFENNGRYVVRLDVLNRSELLGYARNQWLQSPNATLNEIMKQVNRRGLAGLNEAILETRSGKSGMCLALKLMTLYREAQIRQSKDGLIPRSASIVFHCVQGKDRTGMLAMLMQILVGCSDTVIVDDYFRSNAEYANHASTSAAAAKFARQRHQTPQRVRMDAAVFRGTNRAAMISTLQGLRLRHGASLDLYFDRIGFDASWRKRFLDVFGSLPTSRL